MRECLIRTAHSHEWTGTRRERPAARLSTAGNGGTFAGLSRRAIQSSLSLRRADDQVLIDRVRAMGLRLGPEVFAWQSALDRTDAPLQEIACPTLVVAARQDRLRSIAESEELRDGIPGATMTIMGGVGHMIPMEAPEQLSRIIIDWWRWLGIEG